MSSHHARGRDEAVEDERLVVGLRIPYLDRDRVAAVRARRLDAAVDMQRGADPECIPRAVRVPPTAARLDTVGGRHRRKRIRHPQLVRRRVKDERVRVVEATPRRENVLRIAELCGSRRPPELDKARVRTIADRDVRLVHTRTLRRSDRLGRRECPADQVLAIDASPEAAPLVHAIARRAYEKGARFVDVSYFDGAVKRIRAEAAREETLDWAPPWIGRRLLDLGDLDAARVVLSPMIAPGLLQGVDPARAGKDCLLNRASKDLNRTR